MDPLAIPFKQSLCGLPFGFALHDAELRYVYVNQAKADINGRTVAEHAGRTVEEILPPPLARVVRAKLEAALRSRTPVVGVEIRGTTGATPGECVWECDYYPIWAPEADPDGPPTHVAGLVRDVTVQHGLSERLDLLRSVVQQSTDALYVTRPDQQFRFVFVNQATERHYGRPASELLQLRPIDLNPEWTLADLEASWKHMTTIGPLAFETVHRTADRGEVPVWIQAQAVWHGGVGYVAGSIKSLEKERDAEKERLALREQLEHAQRLEAVGLLAGGVAHDFNNLLAVILGNVELLDLEVATPAGREAAAAIRDTARRAADLTRQLLTFSRREAGARRPVSLNAAVRESLRLLHGAMHDRIEVRPSLAEGLPPVLARTAELTQVVMNLLVNARDAMADGGVLRIETRVDASATPQVALVVSDSGVGMDEATRSRIFEPFFTTKAPGSGNGLGLSVVYGIVKQLGGTIGVESAPGRGTSFTIRLPASEEEEPAGRPSGEGVRHGRGELIMVVEDEPALRDAMPRMLARIGYRCITAPDGAEALARLAIGGDEIAAVLTDLRMPRMAGDEFAEHARRMRPSLPVLFMSGQAEDATVRETRLRDELVLAKPFTIEELATVLGAAVG